MADNETSSTPGVTPVVDTPVTGTPAVESVTPQKPTVTLEEALARIAELEHSHKNARAAEDRLGKKLAAYEKAEQDKKDAELSDLERIKKQHADLQSQHDAYKQHAQARIVRYEVEAAANKLNIIDPDAAVRLLDLSELEYDDNGNPINAEKLLEKLIKAKPYLAPVKQEEPERPSAPARANTPALPAMNPGRTSIVPPDSVPAGARVSFQDAYRLMKK